MSLSREQAAFLLDMCKLIQYATEQGFMVTGGELARTPEQQAIYVKTGRSKTMNSFAPIVLSFSVFGIRQTKTVFVSVLGQGFSAETV